MFCLWRLDQKEENEDFKRMGQDTVKAGVRLLAGK